MKKLKPFEFEKGVMELNPKNLTRAKTWEEVDEIVRSSLDNVRRRKDFNSKCHLLSTTLWLTFGSWITMKCFENILNYVDLDYDKFSFWIEDFKRSMEIASLRYGVIDHEYPQFEWFYELKK